MGGDTKFLGWGGTAFHGGGQGLYGGGGPGASGGTIENPGVNLSNSTHLEMIVCIGFSSK